MKKFIFVIILFLFLLIDVKAEEVYLTKEKFYDTYTYFYDNELGRDRYLYTSKYLFENRYAYCLELGKLIESNTYTFSTDFSGINLSKDDLEYVKLVSYYGYDYPTHKTDKYYMAAQQLIWSRLSNIDVLFLKNTSLENVIDVSKEKNEIISLVNSHYTKPSFDSNTYDIIKGKKLYLNDDNNVLSFYESNNKHAIIDGNTLTIDEGINTNELTLTRKSYNNDVFFLYSNGISQKMMSNGTVSDVKSSIKLEVKSGSIKINKFDSENKNNVPLGEASLNGAIYALYDDNDNLVDKFTIGEKEEINGLKIGKYHIKEIKASTGYRLDNNVYDIEITTDNLDINIDVYEDVIKRKVEIFKTFGEDIDGLLTSEEAAVFEIYDKNNNLVDTLTTDSSGYASIILPYGTYTFKQSKGLDGYYKVKDFTVNIDSYDERPIYKLLSDKEVTSRVKIIKKDIDTLDNIIDSDIKFKIFDVKNNKYVAFNVTYPESKMIDTFTLGSDGTFTTPEELNHGTYILYEVDDYMDGYIYNKEGLEFTIDENTNFINDKDIGKVLELTFYNKRVKASININKYGEDIIYKNDNYYYKKIYLSDVIFELYASDDIYENGRLIYDKDSLIEKVTTDSAGEVLIDDLPLGNYYLKEIASSNNNIIDTEVYDINLEYKDQYTSLINENIDIYNYLEKGKLIVNKYDTSTKDPLSNTLIEIRNMDNTVVYKGYTDSNGQIVIDDLLYGDYVISEVEASTGYRLLEEKISFRLDKDEISIDIYNDRIEVPNTSLDIGIINFISVIAIILSIVFIIIFFDKKIVVILSIILLLISLGYIVNYSYHYIADTRNNKRAINDYFNDEIKENYNEKYKYNSILEIPSLNLKRGVLSIDNSYNKAKYNIELVRENNRNIILASHNGNYYNSFFGNLSKLEIGDTINYYKDNKLYKYIYMDKYDIKKNGYADIYTRNDENSIILITCKDNTDDGQEVYIGYLKEVSQYDYKGD